MLYDAGEDTELNGCAVAYTDIVQQGADRQQAWLISGLVTKEQCFPGFALQMLTAGSRRVATGINQQHGSKSSKASEVRCTRQWYGKQAAVYLLLMIRGCSMYFWATHI